MPLDAAMIQHVGRRYFHARVATMASRIVAVGQGVATGRTGWIGNIIVSPDMRGRGLGARMTQQIMFWLLDQGCSTMLLTATEAGEPVYRKLGFRQTAEYVFLDTPRLPPPAAGAVRRLEPDDVNQVARIDASVTGETRVELLEPHLGSGWVWADRDRGLAGFFLPTFGQGLVLADDPAAGVDLLRFKHAFFPRNAVVPAANTVALTFLAEHGARQTARAPRMALGDEADWMPHGVFGRAAGFCG